MAFMDTIGPYIDKTTGQLSSAADMTELSRYVFYSSPFVFLSSSSLPFFHLRNFTPLLTGIPIWLLDCTLTSVVSWFTVCRASLPCTKPRPFSSSFSASFMQELISVHDKTMCLMLIQRSKDMAPRFVVDVAPLPSIPCVLTNLFFYFFVAAVSKSCGVQLLASSQTSSSRIPESVLLVHTDVVFWRNSAGFFFSGQDCSTISPGISSSHFCG